MGDAFSVPFILSRRKANISFLSKRVKTVLDDNRKLFKIPLASLNTDMDVLGRLLSIYYVLLKVQFFFSIPIEVEIRVRNSPSYSSGRVEPAKYTNALCTQKSFYYG